MRDYYCTSAVKAGYAWHPAEFLFQSGFLADDFDVEILDAPALGLPWRKALSRATRRPVALLFGLVGASFPDRDMAFLRKIPARWKAVSGEVVLPDPSQWLEKYEDFDAAVSDFSADGLSALCEGRKESAGVALRRPGGVVPPLPNRKRVFRIPRPRHELFSWGAYRMPLQKRRPFASLLTDFGCPHDCAFCNSGSLFYRRRAADNVDEELFALRRMGFGELFCKDMSFGAHKAHARTVLDLLSGYSFSWHAYGRIEDLEPDLLARMAACGCHLVQVGAEHVDPGILKSAGKGHDAEAILRFLDDAGRVGIDVGLHLILGLPGETRETLSELERFCAGDVPAAYISVNLYAPRRGSPLERRQGGGDEPHDSTRGSDSGALPREDLIRARRRIYRRFYSRPERIRALAGRMRPSEILPALKLFRA